MFQKLLPPVLDNSYRGHRLALWLFAALLALKGSIGLGTIFNGRTAAISADGIPLDTFSPAGEQAFIAVFAAWGLGQVALLVVGLVALVRYRSMVPFMFGLLLLEHLGRKLIFVLLPIARTGPAPGYLINLVIIAAMVVGLALSLWHHGRRQPQD